MSVLSIQNKLAGMDGSRITSGNYEKRTLPILALDTSFKVKPVLSHQPPRLVQDDAHPPSDLWPFRIHVDMTTAPMDVQLNMLPPFGSRHGLQENKQDPGDRHLQLGDRDWFIPGFPES